MKLLHCPQNAVSGPKSCPWTHHEDYSGRPLSSVPAWKGTCWYNNRPFFYTILANIVALSLAKRQRRNVRRKCTVVDIIDSTATGSRGFLFIFPFSLSLFFFYNNPLTWTASQSDFSHWRATANSTWSNGKMLPTKATQCQQRDTQHQLE